MMGLTRQQADCLSLIRNSIRENGVAPSFDELKDALGLKSKSGVLRLVQALERRGYIRRLSKRARAIELLQPIPRADVPFARALKTPAPAIFSKVALTNLRHSTFSAAAHAVGVSAADERSLRSAVGGGSFGGARDG